MNCGKREFSNSTTTEASEHESVYEMSPFNLKFNQIQENADTSKNSKQRTRIY